MLALALVGVVAACNTGDISLGEDARGAKDGGSGPAPDASGDAGPCRPVPPIVPNACPGGTISDRFDERHCWLGFDCKANDVDGGPAPDGGGAPCPVGRGQCVAVVPSNCPNGVIAPESVATCGGIGSACCISCPTPVQPVCPPDRQSIRNKTDAYGCSVGAECFKTWPLGDADSGAALQAKAHDDVLVTLTTNASTGYLWTVDQAAGLAAPTISSTSGPAPGGSGTKSFLWSGLAAGTYSVTLIHKRPFEATPIATFTFTLTVT